MEESPNRPPLLPTVTPATPRAATTPSTPTMVTPGRATQWNWKIAAVAAAIGVLLFAVGVQTWRVESLAGRTAATTPATVRPVPTTSGASPTTPTTPSTTTPAQPTTPTLPGGQALPTGVPGLACVADLIGTQPSATIRRNTLNNQYQSVASWLQKERELVYKQVPTPSLLTRAGLADRVARDVADAYSPTEATLDRNLLSALGAVDASTDLRSVTQQLYGTQVAGFYDPTTRQMVIGTDDGNRPLDPVGEVTLAHEYEHALADQALGLPSLELDVTPSGIENTDRITARKSLVEGDAMLITQRYVLSALSSKDQMGLLDDPTGRVQPLTGQFPHFLERDLTFPYLEGLDFACTLKQVGDWKQVDAAYGEPPANSAQVIFPDRFLAREQAAQPPPNGELSAPWIKARSQTFGAAPLMFLFEAPGDDTDASLPDPKAAVAAWNGGTVTQWADDTRTAIGLSFVQRTSGGTAGAPTVRIQQAVVAPPLCDSVRDWYSAAFPQSRKGATSDDETQVWDGDRQDAVLRCANNNVRLGIGPDIDTARALAR